MIPTRDEVEDVWYLKITNSLTDEVITVKLNVHNEDQLEAKLIEIASTIRNNAEKDFTQMMEVVEY